jgi:hypothetical protein
MGNCLRTKTLSLPPAQFNLEDIIIQSSFYEPYHYNAQFINNTNLPIILKKLFYDKRHIHTVIIFADRVVKVGQCITCNLGRLNRITFKPNPNFTITPCKTDTDNYRRFILSPKTV